MSEVNAEEELAAGRSALECWQTPAEFTGKVKELDQTITSEKLFNQSRIGFLLDAMVVAEFTKFRPAEKGRFVAQKDEWPDAQIGTPKNPTNIEVTEVLEEGRKRGLEYRNHQPSLDDYTAVELNERAMAIPVQLEKAIQRKVRKGYSEKCVLVVYLNMGNSGVLQKEVEEGIANVKKNYAKDFQEICILWQEKLL
jgi:hypothetical protein